MKTLDFTKYLGTYTIEESKKIAKKIQADIFEAEKEKALESAQEIHGSNYTYQLVKGTSVDLSRLPSNQRVCASFVKGHHILLTEKK